jgi:glycosyltransferase involved in cell wall biosynthesis
MAPLYFAPLSISHSESKLCGVGRIMSKKLKVGFASIQDAASRTSWSGTPFNILQALHSNPYVEVEMISPLKTDLRWRYLPLKLLCVLSKRRYDWQREKGSLRYFAAQIEEVVRRRKVDVIFATSSIPVTDVDPAIPVVFWTDAVFHTLEGYYPGNWAPRTSRICRAQEERALRRAAFSCYSSRWAAEMAEQFTSAERVKVLPFGPNLHIEHGKDDVLAWIHERRRRRVNGCNLLFVGMEWSRKGGPVAVEAARQLNEAGIPCTLRVVGPMPPQPLPPFVEAVGFLDKNRPADYERLVNLYRDTDIFILPSRAECFGIVIAEAAAYGIPALVADTGGLAETVNDGVTGFRVPPDDDGTLFAAKATAILADYETFACGSYADFKNRLNWDKSTGMLVELLKRAANR